MGGGGLARATGLDTKPPIKLGGLGAIPGERSQGGVQFPTGGDGKDVAQARERPAWFFLTMAGSADSV